MFRRLRDNRSLTVHRQPLCPGNPVGQTTQSFQERLHRDGADAALDWLIEHYRHRGDYPELFEALKLRLRHRLGLPPMPVEGEAERLDRQTDLELEQGLLDACREVGGRLLTEGRLEEGWMYMRAVADKEAAAAAIADVPVTAENLDAMLALLVHEGLDCRRGTEISLQQRGVCNTITMLDSVVAMRARVDQQAAVSALVRRVHTELLESVVADITRREGSPPQQETLEEILAARPDWLAGGGYHMDTTHIASTVRFARVLDDADDLRLALDIASYGRQLHSQYQYPGEEPFEPLYPMSIALFRVLLGQRVDAGLNLFLQKAEDVDAAQHGPVAVETYVDLLSRIGRHREALKVLLRKMPEGMRPLGIAPSVLELSRLAGDYSPMLEQCDRLDDALGFAAAAVASKVSS